MIFFVNVRRLALVLVAAAAWDVTAATTNINVGDNFFSPRNATIQANDTVTWTWIGNVNHSSTSNNGLWDSGVRGKGFTFSHTFANPGSYPYRCVLHAGHDGSISVQAAANVAPTAAISFPTNGSVFPAPLSGSVLGTVADSDGTVTRVELFAGETLLGSLTNPGSSVEFPVADVPAGQYALRLVVTDNLGATNVSSQVLLTVLDPAPISITSPRLPAPGQFEFSFSSTPGLSYEIRRSGNLSQWDVIQTLKASESTTTVLDLNSTGDQWFYGVRLVTP